MLGILVLLVLVIGGVSGHRYGADVQACDSLKPGHGGQLRQRTRSPYLVETNSPGYVPCQTQIIPGQQMRCGVIVKIKARRGAMTQQFKGFLLQARSRNLNGQIMNVGEFRYMNDQPILTGSTRPGLVRTGSVLSPAGMVGRVGRQVFPGNQFPMQRFPTQFNNMNVVVQRMNCPRGFSVTHTENNPKTEIMLKWYPPLGYNQPVQFIATVVRDFNTYWMNHRSRTLRPRRSPRASANVAQLGRWYSSATRATSGLFVLITSLSSLLFFLL